MERTEQQSESRCGRPIKGWQRGSAFDQSLETLSAVAKNASPQTGPRRFGPKEKLRERFNLFAQGRWEELILASRQCDEAADKAAVRRRCRQQGDTVEKRADRALDLVQMGELSATRHTLDSIAPGNQQTLRALQDPNRRPAVLRSPLPPAILNHVPKVEFDLSQEGLLANLRCSRRRAAGGPSGMTADHIRAILNSERDSKSFWRMCQEFARGCLPEEILRAVRIGRMTAMQKPQEASGESSWAISCAVWWHELWPSSWVLRWSVTRPLFKSPCRPSLDASAWPTSHRE